MNIFNGIIAECKPLVRKIAENEASHGEIILPDNPLLVFELASKYVNRREMPVCTVLGQDPYPQPGVATGLAFANRKDTQVLSPSLKIIFDSFSSLAEKTNQTFIQPDPTLEYLANQGILLLNSSLTVRPYKPKSHTMFWVSKMADIIERISEAYPKMCWILLGSQAGAFSSVITESSYILHENHPSYYARTGTEMPPRVWAKAGRYCEEIFGKTIHWW